MSGALEPGMAVECIDVTSRGEALLGGIPLLMLGAIYHVARVIPAHLCLGPDDGDAVELLEFEGLRGPDGRGVVFSANRFRPLDRDSHAILNQCLQPAPTRDLQDA